jgi:PKD repeat protein
VLGNATLSDGYGTSKSTTVAPSINLKVKKYGRTTLQTEGRITAINATVNVGYGAGVARFVNQIIVEPGGFSAGGDSGALIVVDGKGKNKGDDRKPVGLLFAGSSFITVANPIDAVLARFSVTIDDGTTPPTPNNPPVANAGGPYSGNEGSAISFSGAGSSDVDGTIVSYAWDFGDGAIGSGVTATHIYADNGTYVVTLTVTDDKGATGTDTTNATVANIAPTASAGGPYSGTKGTAITFTGSAVDPGSLDTFSFSWDFGDGSAPASGPTVTHSYAAAGSFVATLTVTDKDGAVDTDTAAVTVTAPASDTVTIRKAEYRTNKERLEVRAVSTDPAAVLRVFDADTLLGVLEEGRLRLRISPSPVRIRVDSDKGDSVTAEVRIR